MASDSGGCSLLGTVLVIALMATGITCLRCYICENEKSNARCTSKLVDCETGMDTCQTMVSYSEVSAKLSIIKTCTKNVSCDLQVNATRDVMPCDQSLGSWVCTTCCQEDQCNLSNAPPRSLPHMEVLVTALLLSAVLQYCLADCQRPHGRKNGFMSGNGHDVIKMSDKG